jgi:hypothetical protein
MDDGQARHGLVTSRQAAPSEEGAAV